MRSPIWRHGMLASRGTLWTVAFAVVAITAGATATGAVLVGRVDGSVNVVLSQSIVTDTANFTSQDITRSIDDKVVVFEDDGTNITIAGEFNIGDVFVLDVPLANLSGNGASAMAILDAPGLAKDIELFWKTRSRSTSPVSSPTLPSPAPLTPITAQSSDTNPAALAPVGTAGINPQLTTTNGTTSSPGLPAATPQAKDGNATTSQPTGVQSNLPQQTAGSATNTAPPGSTTVASQTADGAITASEPTGLGGVVPARPVSFFTTNTAPTGVPAINAQLVAPSIFAQNIDLIGYWKFDEGSGTTAADASGNGNTGNLVGNATRSSTIPPTIEFANPYSLSLDGSGDYVTTASSSVLGMVNGDFTAAAWINIGAFDGGDESVFGQLGGGLNNALHLVIRSQKPYMGFFGNDTGGATTLSTNTWFHIAWRYTQATGEQAIYVNGTLDTSTTGHAPLQGTSAVLIGRWGSGGYLTGMIDDARIYNRALTNSEIASIASGNLGAGLVPSGVAASLSGTYKTGAFLVDINADGVKETVSFVLSDVGVSGTYDTIDLSTDDAVFGETTGGPLSGQTPRQTGPDDDERVTGSGADVRLGPFYTFTVVFAGDGYSASITSKTWFTITVTTTDLDGDLAADDTFYAALTDDDSDGLYEKLDLSIGDDTFGETAGGTLTDLVVDFGASNNTNDESRAAASETSSGSHHVAMGVNTFVFAWDTTPGGGG